MTSERVDLQLILAPLDLDKQCGVIQGPNNTPCTRSLTCKSHSMGAKRAVAGRSEPYDVLLAAYQKKAIGRPQAGAVASTTAQKSVKNLKKLANQSKSPATSAAASAPHEEYVDSDEEVENVMQSLRLTRPAPLAERCYYFPKRRRQCYRLRDILLDAITPKAAPVIPVSDSNWSLLSMMSNTAGAGAEAATAPMHTGHYPFQNASGGTTRMGSHQSSPVSMIGFSQMDANTLFGSNAGMEPASPSSVSTYSSAR
ncbi:SCA7, zinc-binding domain-containing protein [Radiomyces spectabilis]|uniref:SCA7, zinc-binding domain-containing protein n=1 Tax=Radiomyces spectabilis TaxID=64574 RepID=UPI00221E8B2E|nr:SCA7, zinc-binding domain-containing protein [Radiomyces spectabilis]KAI8369376.1 SCA7, zinc-binding domain-containing protein [Radiomyces spectabilis]